MGKRKASTIKHGSKKARPAAEASTSEVHAEVHRSPQKAKASKKKGQSRKATDFKSK